jgi:hypothetical protein
MATSQPLNSVAPQGDATVTIPKPQFASCDETSLKFRINYTPKGDESLALQYKEPHADWAAASEVAITNDEVKIADVVDLKPGTPYFVRVVVINTVTGERKFGPETVFDTKPIDCTPKGKRKCVIS